jgi:hypothetical protein
MNSPVGAVGSILAGVVIALFAVIGGVNAVSPSANPPSKSEQVVLYDAP